MGIEDESPEDPDLCEFCGEPEEMLIEDISTCKKCAEHIDTFKDGLIEKGWNPELWGYFLPKDFHKMWVSISDTDVTLLNENGVQVFKAEEQAD